MSKEAIAQQPAINIEISEEVAEGIYSNLAIISHSNAEFVVDFIRLMPNLPKAKVKSRIVLTPQHAKRLLYALRDNVQKFEMQFGKIEEPDQPLPPSRLVQRPVISWQLFSVLQKVSRIATPIIRARCVID